MKADFLYLVINFFILFSFSYQVAVVSANIPTEGLFAIDEQLIMINFDSEISVSKVNAAMIRSTITYITGDCTEVKTNLKQANCSFDLTSVTPDDNYNLEIKYDNTQLSNSNSFLVQQVLKNLIFVLEFL